MRQMESWAKETNGEPRWTTETRMRMGEMVHLLETRVEKENQWGRKQSDMQTDEDGASGQRAGF